ncbi:MAG: hypothetical protein LIP12_09760 [Clostridiales bacterium]|nr:hypothetical protein [Clostridiales bacterium]
MRRRTKSPTRGRKGPSTARIKNRKNKDNKKEDNKNEKTVLVKSDSYVVDKVEDGVMKVMMEFFSEEMLPVFGITTKATGILATEEVQIKLSKGYEDFNLEMEDGSIAHFEFQSTNKGTEGLRRFRVYESSLSYKMKKPVITYVLFSGHIMDPMAELEDGINLYKVIPIIMSKEDADSLLADLRAKIDRGEPLTRSDLVTLPLLPLYGGKSSQQERIRAAFEITAKADNVSRPDVEKIEAAVYAMATKFLTNTELSQLKGEIKMTYLGQLLVEDGRKEGRAEERKNTERERQRAEKAEADARRAEADARKAEADARRSEAELQRLKKQLGLI